MTSPDTSDPWDARIGRMVTRWYDRGRGRSLAPYHRHHADSENPGVSRETSYAAIERLALQDDDS